MGRLENMESHPKPNRDLRSVLGSDGSFPSLHRLLPSKLANAQFAMNLVFTHERWENHRSTLRYLKHLAFMFSSNVFRALLGPVAIVMVISVFVGLYETLLKEGALPRSWPHVTLALGQAFNLTAFALSLLLVFRTNSSYDRWWEARKLWGGVVNRSRDLVRQGLTFYRDEDVQLKEVLARYTMAFPVVLMAHLRADMDVAAELKARRGRGCSQRGSVARPLLPRPAAIAVYLSVLLRLPPLAVQEILQPDEITRLLPVLAEINKTSRADPFARMRLDENLTFFEDAMGSMERILRTPIPLRRGTPPAQQGCACQPGTRSALPHPRLPALLAWAAPYQRICPHHPRPAAPPPCCSYTRHTSRFLLIWLMMLPFTMWAAYSWGTVFISAVFAFLMLGIDEIGVQIEEPFGVLPIEAYCQTIERNIRELLSRNYEVCQTVLRANYPIEAAPVEAEGFAGGGGAALGLGYEPDTSSGSGSGSGASGDDFEFGEMTGAAAPASPAKARDAGGGGGVISLTASAAGGVAGPGAAPRRVRFAADEGARSPAAGGGPPSPTGRDMIEIELGSAAETVPLAGGPRSSYASTWLN
eukprot:scaffold14.g1239.t1